MDRLLTGALDLVVPNPCLVCRRRRASRHGLCPDCHRRLRIVPPGSCPGCGLPRPAHRSEVTAARCARCQLDPPPWTALVTPWSYEPPLDALIKALKFGSCEVVGDHLGSALAEVAGCILEDHELVAPVPLHPWRRLARGYNQSELIAASLARGLRLPVGRPLRRIRSTPPQVGLDRRRRRSNVARAFRCTTRGRRLVAGRRVLLVDDVVTTGATLGSACRALLAGGAISVTAVAVARVPSDIGAEG